ncbi:MAG: CHASE3 domain-containing protein [Planctomycetaceae bacterium]|nr:CHASE3 domain-containing protein [Planctomycetales bacterium]MCB9924142.1 CHASE3 domain-containing protein [Planctomycetaceae bacterium]
MPYRKPTNWITLVLAIASALVAAFGVVTYQNTVSVRRNEAEVSQSYAVREATYKLRSSIKDMEAGQRGYLITGDATYLQPYESGVENVAEEFERLRELTSDNLQQTERLNRLELLFREKRSEIEEAIELRRNAPGMSIAEEALQVVVTGRGKRVMDEMRTLFNDILEEEAHRLIQREATAEARAKSSENYIIAGNLLAITLFVLTGLVAHLERVKRDAAEARARSSQSKMREQVQILNQVRDAILVCDMDDRVIFWNRGAELLLGITDEQAMGKNVSDVLFANQRELWEQGRRALMETGGFSNELRRPGSREHEVIIEQRRSLIRDESGNPAAQLIINFDITDRKREEAEKRRSQRMESIGTLAGGIAHDLNNVLTPILMSAKLLKRNDSNRERLTDTIVASADRGAQMIRKLLAFAGGEHEAQTRLDIREVLHEVEDILSHTLPKTIDLQVSYGDDLYPVSGNSTELSQVIMNLAINARDAMPDGGRLEIRAENTFVGPSRAKRSDALRVGPHVLLTVADTGMGVPREIIERIFDPFFTTKEQGKGTGLGLATTLGIVRASQGEITVYSEFGHGTSFAIYLPAMTANVLATQTLNDAHTDVSLGNGEMILLVDDEPLILDSASDTLQAAGYRVTRASDGAEAISAYQRQADTIDLVILDMMMPDVDGIATKNKLRAIDPDVRIIASSGLRRPGADGATLSEFDGFLAKPYSDDQLLRLVRQVLTSEALAE